MRLRDALGMAAHNLICRKRRTLLNLIGVVIGCTMLLLTLAGTRGVSSGIQAMIDGLEEARRFAVYASWKPSPQPPDELLQIEGEIGEERRERLLEAVKDNWLARFGDYQLLDDAAIDSLQGIDHVVEIIPEAAKQCYYELLPDPRTSGESLATAGFDGTSAALSLQSDAIEKNLLVGDRISVTDTEGVVLSEFAAYRMGFVEDAELEQLIGRRVRVRWVSSNNPILGFLQYLSPADEDRSLLANLKALSTVKQLVDEIELTNLSSEQQELIRKIFLNMASSEEAGDAQTQAAEMPPGKATDRQTSAGQNQVVELADVSMTRELVVRGIVKPEETAGLTEIINQVSGHADSEILVHPQLTREIRAQFSETSTIYHAAGIVDSVDHLLEVTEAIELQGYSTHSAVWVVETIQTQIRNILFTLSGLAALILLITALAIFNAMTISVVERAPEFGIMKSIGADARDLLTLMLFEGAITGMLAVAIAFVLSVLLINVLGFAVQNYVEYRLDDVYTESIFIVAWYDIVIVLFVGVGVCVLASLLPAVRAARLEPIVTMRRR